MRRCLADKTVESQFCELPIDPELTHAQANEASYRFRDEATALLQNFARGVVMSFGPCAVNEFV
jgi:hypothetical protein